MEQKLFENFFENFTHSIAAVRLLLQKAHQQGDLIEGLVLYVSIIDALLRNLIAHKTAIPIQEGAVTTEKLLFDNLILNKDLFQHNEKTG